ncbi:MAG: FAD-dependent oxidoreductase [Paludibacter sp.]|nr:FAD-dependent oxidoreductase [Paludibacter sp.]
MNIRLLTAFYLFIFTSCAAQKVDVLVVGGGASGTTAGIQAARMGVNTLIVEETAWLGGMLTSAGVSAVDGNYKLPSGIFGEFRDSLEKYYGGANALKTGWVSNVLFEPKVGNDILQKMVKAQAKLSVWQNTKFVSSKKTADGWNVTVEKNGINQLISAKIMIDATELGDVAKACGVKYDIGMEARSVCGEDIAPLQANDIIQDLTYVMILKDYGVNKTIAKPEGYDASKFYCTAQSPNCTNPTSGQTVWSKDKMMTYGKLPNGKYMINWPIEGNDYYVNILEMNELERKTALDKAKQFSLCYLYYLQTELGFSTYGLDDSQFPTADKFPMIPYHRESRRIHGLVRFNVNHVTKPFTQPEALYRTGIAVGDYPIDHHHKRYLEWDKLPELHFYPVPSYNVPIGVMVPQDVDNLIIAEKSISVSNLLNGSTRLQPVVLQIGQAAGAMAAISVQQQKPIAATSVRLIQTSLLDADGYLMPYLDLAKNDIHFKAIQRIGATGILKGEGKNVGWSNETWFYTDKTVLVSELKQGLSDYEPAFVWSASETELSVSSALNLLVQFAGFYHKDTVTVERVKAEWTKLGLSTFSLERKITRKEFAVLLDYFIQPFLLKQIDFKGNFITVPTEVMESKIPIHMKYNSGKIVVQNIDVSKLELFNENGQLLARSSSNSISYKTSKCICILNVYIGNALVKSEKILIQ